MTESSLKKGHDIQDEISSLKWAIKHTNKNALFQTTESSCEMSGGAGIPFLSELHARIKHEAITAINKRITALEKEFAAL